MTTIAYTSSPAFPLSQSINHYNKYAIASLSLAFLFVLYFFVPHVGILNLILRYSVLFILFVPAAALALSILSLRQISYTHDRGVMLSYIALTITTFYFMIALAIPVVLIGFYLLYTYVI